VSKKTKLSPPDRGEIETTIKLAKLLTGLTMFPVQLRKSTTPVVVWGRALDMAKKHEFAAYSLLRLDGDEWLLIYDEDKNFTSDGSE
jgi:hypothetical protein